MQLEGGKKKKQIFAKFPRSDLAMLKKSKI